MTNNDDFFMERKPAAVLKHAMLVEYATVFGQMMCSKTRGGPSWIIDGYAGAGAYESPIPSGEETPGSPLLILQTASKCRQSFDLKAAFIEENPRYAAQLRERVRPYTDRGLTGTVFEGDVATQLPAALYSVGDAPLVTFLDPFGVALDFKTLTGTLLSDNRRQVSEVILNINVSAVGRLGGWLTARDGEVVPTRDGTSGIERVDRFLGGVWWRDVFYRARNDGGLSANDAAEHVVTRFRDLVKDSSGCSSVAIPVRRRPGHKPLFHLTLFHRNSIAAYKFLDASVRANRKWRETFKEEDLQRLNEDENTLFGPEGNRELVEEAFARREREQTAEMVRRLQERTRALLLARGKVALLEDFEELIGEYAGLAGESHVRGAWKALATDPDIVYAPSSRTYYRSEITLASRA